MNWSNIFSASLLFTLLLKTTPLLYAALGGVLTQQANILNIGLEGMMLAGAFGAVSVGAATQSATLAVLAAIVSSMLFGLLYAYISLYLKADNIIVGIGINLLASGVTIFLLNRLYHNEGNFSPAVFPHLWKLNLPFLNKIPLIGVMLNGQTILVFIAMILVWLTHMMLYRTRIGMHIRAVGEDRGAAEAAGINPRKIQFFTIVMSGLFCGLGGAQLAMATLNMFVRDMVNGRGFIALAAETFGNATPIGSFFASLIFGGADAISDRMQTGKLPPQFVLMVPYLVTLVALAVMMIRKRMKARQMQNREA